MKIDNRNELGLTEASGCSCCSTASTSAATENSTDAAVTTDVLVSGMTCSHCVNSVTQELSAIEGVDGVSVDLNAGGESRVSIRSSQPISASAVEAAVEEAGYALVGSAT